MQPPIMFSKLIEHYTSIETLSKTKTSTLKEEFKDIITLADFLITKMPSKIKTLIAKTKEEESLMRRKIQ